jgi:hypothetical protein
MAMQQRLSNTPFRNEQEALAVRRDEERRRREAVEDAREPVAVQRSLFEEDGLGEGDELESG